MKIDSNFPGGNIVVEKIGKTEVWLHQDLRDTGQDWFYWYFRVTGAERRTVRFHFTQSKAIGTRGPAVRRRMRSLTNFPVMRAAFFFA